MGNNLKLIIVVLLCVVSIGVADNVIQSNYEFSIFEYATNLLTGGAIAGNEWVGNNSNLNCSVYHNSSVPTGFNEILALYNYTDSHISLPNETHRGEYGLYCKDVNDGGTLNWTNPNATVYLRSYNTSNSHVEMFNKTIPNFLNNLTIYHESGSITCNYQTGLYGNCTNDTQTCLLTVPYQMIGNDTDLHVADCNFTNAYDTSICCELSSINVSVYEDGVLIPEGGNITYSAKPTNLTISTNIVTGRILVKEYNGLTLATLMQYDVSNLASIGQGIINIQSQNTSIAIIPTGGVDGSETDVGDYYIEIEVQNNNNATLYTRGFNVTNRLTSTVTGPVSIPNQADIAYTRQDMSSVSIRAKEWFIAGGGVNYDLTVNGTIWHGNIVGQDFNLTKGKPTGLRIEVLDDTQTPVSGAVLNITETNGYALFALPEYSDTVVRSISLGNLTTNSTGVVRFSVIPSGGLNNFEGTFGNYTFEIEVYHSNGSYMNTINFTVDREELASTGSAEGVYNQPSMAYALQNLNGMATRAKEWLIAE